MEKKIDKINKYRLNHCKDNYQHIKLMKEAFCKRLINKSRRKIQNNQNKLWS